MVGVKQATATEFPSICGFGTVEVLVALSLWSFVLLSLTGLFMVALSAGTVAETSSVATNLARARLEEVRSMPPEAMAEVDGTTSEQQVPPGRGRPYTVHTSVDTSHPGFLDVTVTVTWQVAYGSACASGAQGATCVGKSVTQRRTLQTRLRRP